MITKRGFDMRVIRTDEIAEKIFKRVLEKPPELDCIDKYGDKELNGCSLVAVRREIKEEMRMSMFDERFLPIFNEILLKIKKKVKNYEKVRVSRESR